MDEYEALEEDLQALYEKFMEKFRNQAYLEQLLEEYNNAEQDKFEVRMGKKVEVGALFGAVRKRK